MTVEILVLVAFCLIHLQAWRLHWLDVIPRSRWLSAAGGISVAYVFVHLFPELAAAQQHLDTAFPALAFVEQHAYLVALLGLLVFYSMERLVRGAESEKRASTGIFWLHLTSFALYNSLIGYLLIEYRERSLQELLLFSSAIGLHFLVNDYGLRATHQDTYFRHGRWLLSGAIISGWLLGLAVQIPQAASAVLLAFLAGGVVLNVLKEELPAERKSRLLPFLCAAAGYSALLVAT